jgi:hypothetical protein
VEQNLLIWISKPQRRSDQKDLPHVPHVQVEALCQCHAAFAAQKLNVELKAWSKAY